jgi:long-chain fatty acid transport protein
VAVDYTNNCNPLNASCTGNGETTRGTFQTHVSLLGLAYNYQF